MLYNLSMEENFPIITPMVKNPQEKLDLLTKQIFINSVQNVINKKESKIQGQEKYLEYEHQSINILKI